MSLNAREASQAPSEQVDSEVPPAYSKVKRACRATPAGGRHAPLRGWVVVGDPHPERDCVGVHINSSSGGGLASSRVQINERDLRRVNGALLWRGGGALGGL